MAARPQPLTVTDELLVHLLDGHEQLTATVGEMRDLLRDRLPEPQPAAQDPGTRELREPALPGTGDQPAPGRRGPARPAPAPAPEPGPSRDDDEPDTPPAKRARATARKATKRS